MQVKKILKHVTTADKVLAGLVVFVTGAATMMAGVKTITETFLPEEDRKAIEDVKDE
jgi:multidrug efflux pump subunit AcrB